MRVHQASPGSLSGTALAGAKRREQRGKPNDAFNSSRLVQRGSHRGEPKPWLSGDAVKRTGGGVRPAFGRESNSRERETDHGRNLSYRNAVKKAGELDNNNENTSGAAAGDAAGTQTERIGALGIVREKRREEADAAQHAEAMMRKYQDRDQPNIKREQDPWNRSVAAARRGERRRS